MSSMRSASSRTKISTRLRSSRPLTLEVQQTAGRGHQNVQAPLDLVHLGLLANAAEDDGGAKGRFLP